MENHIRTLRESAGLTQLALAQQTGVSRQTINAIENNKYDPTLGLAFSLARTLGVTVDVLFVHDGNAGAKGTKTSKRS